MRLYILPYHTIPYHTITYHTILHFTFPLPKLLRPLSQLAQLNPLLPRLLSKMFVAALPTNTARHNSRKNCIQITQSHMLLFRTSFKTTHNPKHNHTHSTVKAIPLQSSAVECHYTFDNFVRSYKKTHVRPRTHTCTHTCSSKRNHTCSPTTIFRGGASFLLVAARDVAIKSSTFPISMRRAKATKEFPLGSEESSLYASLPLFIPHFFLYLPLLSIPSPSSSTSASSSFFSFSSSFSSVPSTSSSTYFVSFPVCSPSLPPFL